jgi:hypothetical protein
LESTSSVILKESSTSTILLDLSKESTKEEAKIVLFPVDFGIL